MADNCALWIDKVSVSYGKKEVLENVSIAVKNGEFFGLMGLNGAGKTTLIKTVLALRMQQAGDIKIFGRSNACKVSKKEIAYLPERFEPPWFLSGLEFLKFSLRLYDRAFEKDEVYAVSDRLGLSAKILNQRVQTYSKGMRQKLGLLGTILTNCRLLILDEPMSGLDPVARTQVKDMLLEYKHHERAVFLSSHILSDMDELCDRVAVLHDARILYDGKASVLKKEAKEDTLERAFLHSIEKGRAA